MPIETAAAPAAAAPATTTAASTSGSSGIGSSSPSPETRETSVQSSSASTQTTTAAETTEAGGQPGELNHQDFDSLEDYASALIDKKKAERAAGDTTQADGTDAEQTEDLSPEKIAPVGDEPQTDDGAQAKKEAVDPNAPTLDLEDDNEFTPKALNEKINANPELKKALEADPAVKNAMFRNARLASEAGKYKEIFPDVESAQSAAQSAATFTDLDNLFINASNPEGVSKFMDRWAEMAMFVDDQGRPIVENGMPKLHPAFTTLIDTIANDKLGFWERKAQKEGDHELLAALEVVRERSKSASSQPQDQELPPHIKAAADAIKAREGELNRRQLEQQQAELTKFDKVVGDEANSKIDSLIDPALDKAALPDFVRSTARDKIDAAIMESLGKNKFFQARMAELARYPLTTETKQQRVSLIMSHVQAVAGPIVRQVLREASQPVLAKQGERQAKIETQVARTRSEPKSTSGAATTAAQVSPEKLFAQIKNEYTGQHGEEPSAQKLIELWALARRGGR